MNKEQKLQVLTDIKYIAAAFDEISNAVGNGKQVVLMRYRESELIRKALWYQFNPYIVFGLSDKKIHKTVVNQYEEDNCLSLFEWCEVLNALEGVSDAVIGRLQSWIKQIEIMDVELENMVYNITDFLNLFFTKSIRLGITAKSLNKVFGADFIPIISCMLANKYFDNPKSVEGELFVLTQKLDGIRMLAIWKNGAVTCFSRQGQVIDGLVEIEKELSQMLEQYHRDNIVLDGELLIDCADGINSVDGYKATIQAARVKGEKKGLTYHIFDIVDSDEFAIGKSKANYLTRMRNLSDVFNSCSFTPFHLCRLPILYMGADTEQIFKWLSFMRENNKEGVMINLADAPYECKRTSNLLKVKVMQDADLMIAGAEEGQGANKGTLGALLAVYKDNLIGVGSGFTKGERDWFWEHKEELIGRVITVQYFEETQNALGIPSLRFPVFKELREEGKEVSYF